MHKLARGLLMVLGLSVLVWSGWQYASTWGDKAKNAEYYRLYLAGRVTVSGQLQRETWINAKLSLDRARFVAVLAGAAGLSLIGVGWWLPQLSARVASGWSRRTGDKTSATGGT